MSIITDVLTGGVGSIVETVGKLAGEFITTDKERMSAEIEQRKLGVEIEKAYLADVDSARKMQVAALQQDDVFSKRFVYYFAIGWSLFAMAFFAAVTFADIPEKNIRVVDTILGFMLGTAIASIFNYFLGSTSASRGKDATIKAMAEVEK